MGVARFRDKSTIRNLPSGGVTGSNIRNRPPEGSARAFWAQDVQAD